MQVSVLFWLIARSTEKILDSFLKSTNKTQEVLCLWLVEVSLPLVLPFSFHVNTWIFWLCWKGLRSLDWKASLIVLYLPTWVPPRRVGWGGPWRCRWWWRGRAVSPSPPWSLSWPGSSASSPEQWACQKTSASLDLSHIQNMYITKVWPLNNKFLWSCVSAICIYCFLKQLFFLLHITKKQVLMHSFLISCKYVQV